MFGFPTGIGLDRGQENEELFGAGGWTDPASARAVPSRIIVRVVGLSGFRFGFRVFFHLKQVRHPAPARLKPNNCSPVARLTTWLKHFFRTIVRCFNLAQQLRQSNNCSPVLLESTSISRTCGTSRTIIPRLQLPACWIT